MANRFDFEQCIMQCWSVIDDIRSIEQCEELTEDQLSMALLGLAQLYEIKFDNLFSMFEELIKEGKIT